METVIMMIIVALVTSGWWYVCIWGSAIPFVTALIIVFDGIVTAFLGKYIEIKLRKKG